MVVLVYSLFAIQQPKLQLRLKGMLIDWLKKKKWRKRNKKIVIELLSGKSFSKQKKARFNPEITFHYPAKLARFYKINQL